MMEDPAVDASVYGNYPKRFGFWGREQMIASDDWVVSRWQVTGTHRGEFNDIPATNRRVSVPGCMVSEIGNGRIVKTFISCDQLAVLQQLGVAIGKATGSE